LAGYQSGFWLSKPSFKTSSGTRTRIRSHLKNWMELELNKRGQLWNQIRTTTWLWHWVWLDLDLEFTSKLIWELEPKCPYTDPPPYPLDFPNVPNLPWIWEVWKASLEVCKNTLLSHQWSPLASLCVIATTRVDRPVTKHIRTKLNVVHWSALFWLWGLNTKCVPSLCARIAI
jgi:hypothetical protein